MKERDEKEKERGREKMKKEEDGKEKMKERQGRGS